LRFGLNPLQKMVWALSPLMVLACFAGWIALGGPILAADGGGSAQIRFTYQNPQLQPPKYVLTVNEDGTGHFRSEGGGQASTDPGNIPAEPQDRPIRISKAVRESIFAAARKSKLFAIACDDGGKNIAFQGTKTLQFESPEGQGSCTYNWSKNPQIDKVTDQFEAIAATLDEGSKLERQYEHGRLSLDSELELLDQMVRDGRALELENIAPILQKLADDEAVLQRVQRRARALLAQAKND
jgi:hypothetical protein